MKEKLVNLTEKLFSDVGLKIKKIAKILFCINLVIGILASVGGIIFSIGILFDNPRYWENYVIPFLISVGGLPLFLIINYLSLMPLYAFGDLVDNVNSINKKKSGEDSEDRRKKEQLKQRIAKINKLHAQGLITDYEYRNALNGINEGR